MARLELPSGGWIEYREELRAGDKLRAHEAATFRTTQSDGKDGKTVAVQESRGNVVDQMRLALLGGIITAWSFDAQGVPIPAQHPMGMEAGLGVLVDTLSLEDWNALEEAVEPMMEKIAFSAPKNRARSKG